MRSDDDRLALRQVGNLPPRSRPEPARRRAQHAFRLAGQRRPLTRLGARPYGVGRDGATFGVVNNTRRNVYELLLAVNKKAVNGVLYNGDATLQAECADLFNALNQAGSI